MKRIDFLCVGPQRTASSWIDRALRTHPSLSFPANVKETFFFDLNYERGFDWYFNIFEKTEDRYLLGEVGSTYFESDKARKRILEQNPRVKIIIMVRNPIARSFSSFGHEYAKGRVGENFFEAVDKQPRIVESGRYSFIAPKWELDFSRKQIFYLVQEDIQKNPQAQIEAVCKFLDIKPISLPEKLQERYGQASVPRYHWLAAAASRVASTLRRAGMYRLVEGGKKLGLKKVYQGGDSSKLYITRPVFDYLLQQHKADIEFLEQRLGRSFPHWRNPYTYGLEE